MIPSFFHVVWLMVMNQAGNTFILFFNLGNDIYEKINIAEVSETLVSELLADFKRFVFVMILKGSLLL